MGELFDRATSAEALYAAFQDCKKGTDWKGSVQRFELDLLRNIRSLQRELRTGTYRQEPLYEFNICERGKNRHIKSLTVRDRVVQRTICDNILTPSVRPYLIYDNGASIKGKGITFTRNRMQAHLEKFIRRHGLNGYILQVDFQKFFDNIPHDRLIECFAKVIDDPQALRLIEDLIKPFEIDISHWPEAERARCMDRVFNTLTYEPPPKEQAGKYFMAKSMGIGSQISQVAGIFYLSSVDNYCKIVRGCKYYGRYMDDIYIIHENRDFLQNVLEGIKSAARELGMFVHPNKTQIKPLRHGFTFLQVKYTFTPTGGIIKRIAPVKIARERRQLKKYRRLLEEGLLTHRDIACAYHSWRGNATDFRAHNSVQRMDELYNQLFFND